MDHLELYALRDLIAISEKGGYKFVKGLEATLAHYAKHISTDCLVRNAHARTPAHAHTHTHACAHACILGPVLTVH